MITKNAQSLLSKSLESVKDIAHEIIIVDNYSTDETIKIAKKYKAHIFSNSEENLGKQKAYALQKATSQWILILDSDEILSEKLKEEIKNILTLDKIPFDGYLIPYLNHFQNKKIIYGGESYKKLTFFKKSSVSIKSKLVHEEFALRNSNLGSLKNYILHYSYQTIPQVFKKFTDYANKMAHEKIIKGEKVSIKKLFIYPIHMFWSRFIKDKGYRDGLFRIPLDIAFSYMEFLLYLKILIFKIKRSL